MEEQQYKLLDGKAVSAQMKQEMAEEVARIKATGGKIPHLAAILVGHDGGIETYVASKVKTCNEIGFKSSLIRYEADVTEEELLRKVDELNNDPDVDGFIVQLPLPKHISEQAVIDAIDPKKDVDAFHPVNVGKIMVGNFDFVPCTPAGVMELLDEYKIDPKGKECVVVGRSNIVGKPMSMLLLHRHGTVTICHSRTQDLAEVCRRADILVAAVGKAGFITPDMVKEGAVVIDVGINRNAEGKVCGDVAPEVMEKASYMTPVPGGAGPMTITMLMKNTLKAAKLQNGIQ